MRNDRGHLFITYIFDTVSPEKYNHIHKRFFSVFTNIQHKHYVLEAKSSRPWYITWARRHFIRNVLFVLNLGETGKRSVALYEGWNFNSGNYLFTTDAK